MSRTRMIFWTFAGPLGPPQAKIPLVNDIFAS